MLQGKIRDVDLGADSSASAESETDDVSNVPKSNDLRNVPKSKASLSW